MGKISIVASGKGGAGKSTVTTNLGLSLARLGKRVLLVDGDILLRSLDLMLGVADQTVYHWLDVLEGRCSYEQAIVPVQSVPGLYLLPAPLEREAFSREEDFRALCQSLQPVFDWILIDCPAGIGEAFDLCLAPAEQALVVTTPDQVCVRCAAFAAEEALRRLPEESRLILNRFDPLPLQKGIYSNVDEIVDQVGVRLLGVIPEKGELAFCASRGTFLSPKEEASQAFGRIARRLLGENIPLKNLAKLCKT